MNRILFYIIIYIITQYIISFSTLFYLMKYHKEKLGFTGIYKKDYGILLMLSLAFAFAPVTNPLILIIYLKNMVMGK